MRARCPKHGVFMKYAGRYWGYASTSPLGLFACHHGHEQVLTLPYLWVRRGVGC